MALPADFRWGAGASSLSTEGVAPAADWSRFERDGRVPLSGDGAGFASDHVEDLRLAAAIGLTDVRITAEWARLEPRPGTVDGDALDRIRAVLVAAVEAGLRPWVTLVHGTLPGWFVDDEGGFAEASARDRWWSQHVDRTAEATCWASAHRAGPTRWRPVTTWRGRWRPPSRAGGCCPVATPR